MKWLLLVILSFHGCKKCADCTTTVTQKVMGQDQLVGTSVTEMCGDDLKEADGYTNTATSTVNGYTATITTRIDCE